MLATLFALLATLLTSWLPIPNKRLLQDARPALVAWAVNTALLPILAAGTLLVTQCSLRAGQAGLPVACTPHLPQVNDLFVVALLASAVLNGAATLLSIRALAQAGCLPGESPLELQSRLYAARRLINASGDA